jgi:hypothetical protein
VDARELENFFVSRGADKDCAACGHDGDWVRVEADQDLKLPTLGGGGNLDVAAVLCGNCGYVRSLAVIQGAVRNPDESPPD